METQGKSASLIRTSRCCRFVYLNEFTGTCSSIHSIPTDKSEIYDISNQGVYYIMGCPMQFKHLVSCNQILVLSVLADSAVVTCWERAELLALVCGV